MEYAHLRGHDPRGRVRRRVDDDLGRRHATSPRSGATTRSSSTSTGSPGGPLGGRVRLALIRTDGAGEKSNWLLHRMKDQRPGHWSPTSKARHANEPAADAASTDAASDAPPAGTAAEPSRTTPHGRRDADRRRRRSAEEADADDDDGPHEVEPILVRPMLATSGTLGMVRARRLGARVEVGRHPRARARRRRRRAAAGRRGNDVTATLSRARGTAARAPRRRARRRRDRRPRRPGPPELRADAAAHEPRAGRARSSGSWASCPCGCCSSTCSRSPARR